MVVPGTANINPFLALMTQLWRRCCCSSLLYSAILWSRADSLRSCCMWSWMSWLAFHSVLEYNIDLSGVLTALFGCYVAGATWNCCPLGAFSVQPCTSLQCRFMQSHIRRVHACLVVTCHLHFWQNDRDLSRATAATRGWNGYRNRSRHRKLTLEKKKIPAAPAGIRTRDLSITSPAL